MTLDELRQRTVITVEVLAADVLHCGRNQAYAAVREGLVPSIRVGSVIRIPIPGLLRVLGDISPPVPPDSDGPDATSEPLATTDPTTKATRDEEHHEVCRPVRPLRNAG